jgi:hypothetical protein
LLFLQKSFEIFQIKRLVVDFMGNKTFSRVALTFPLLCILSLFSAKKSYAANEFWQSGFSAANVQDLKWTTDSSVGAAYEIAYIQPSASAWNGISSKVKFSKGTASSYQVKYFVAGNPILSQVGKIVPFCSGGSGTACVEQAAGGTSPTPKTWTAAQLYLYESNMVALGYTQAKRVTAASHEVGHIFSMSHNPASGGQAPANFPSLMAAVIGQYSTLSVFDRINLQTRWGL